MRPSSKLAVDEQLLDRMYPDLLKLEDLELQHIYRALDILADGKDDLERSLFLHDKDIFNQHVDVVLYDLTTLRFESTGGATALTGQMGPSAGQTMSLPFNSVGWLEGVCGSNLSLELSGAQSVDGSLVYVLIPC